MTIAPRLRSMRPPRSIALISRETVSRRVLMRAASSDWFGGVIDGFLAEIGDTSARGRSLDEAALCVTLVSLAQESSRLGEALRLPEITQ